MYSPSVYLCVILSISMGLLTISHNGPRNAVLTYELTYDLHSIKAVRRKQY